MVEYNYIIEISVTLFWLLIFTFFAHIIYSNKKNDEAYKYYLIHYYWVIATSFGFAFVFTQILAGDTTGYWKGAVALNDLMLKEPSNYLFEIVTTENFERVPKYLLNSDIRFFGRHYIESNSWFVSKVFSFFSFFTFGSYYALTLWIGVFSSWITWRFYLYITKFTQLSNKWITISLLFIPSIGFWCHSVSKDTLVYLGILVSIRSFLGLFLKNERKSIKTWFYLMVSSYILYHTRSFVILSILVGVLVAFTFEFNKSKSQLARFLTRVSGFTIIAVAFTYYITQSQQFGELSNEALLNNAKIIQQDFVLNSTYDGDKYDLGIEDYTMSGIIQTFPFAVFTALFRPLLWDGVNAMLMVNALETTIILIVSIYLLFKYIQSKEKLKLSNESKILILILIGFILTMAFFVGFVSGLYGVLVRMRAPLLPLFLLFVTLFVTRISQALKNEKH